MPIGIQINVCVVHSHDIYLVSKMRYLLVLLIVITTIVHVQSLFLNETFLYKGVPRKLGSSFNITLSRIATIPMSLKLNSMCQVPQFQLDKFDSSTGFRFSSSGKRGTDFSCSTVKYCDNGGLAGSYDVCPGSRHQLVDSSCIDNLYKQTQDLIAASSTQTLQAAKSFTEDAITTAITGVQNTFDDTISSLSGALTSQISSQEATLTQAIQDSSAAQTLAMKSNINNLAAATSANLASLQASINRQLADASGQINQLSSTLTSVTQSLQGSIASVSNDLAASIYSLSNATTYNLNRLKVSLVNSNNVNLNVAAIINSRINKLDNYIASIIDTINYNSLKQQKSLMSVMDSVVQLSVKAERAARFESEGVDISSLLSQWSTYDQSSVFQDVSNATYKYVSSGYIGVYDSTPIDVNYPSDKDLIGSTAYRCYEKGAVPNPPSFVSGTTPIYVGSGVGSQYIGSDVYSIINQIVPNAVDINQILSFVLSSSVSSAQIAVGTSTTGSGVFYSYVQVLQSGNFIYGYVTDALDSYHNSLPSYTTSPPTTTITTAPTGDQRFVTLIDNTGALDNVTPDTYTFTNEFITTADIAAYLGSLEVVPGGNTATTSIPRSKFVQTQKTYGSGHFVLSHPTMGDMNIHKCVKMGATNSDPIYDNWDTNNSYAYTDSNGRVRSGGANGALPGQLSVNVNGLPATTISMAVRQLSVTGLPVANLIPDTYYYTSDIWCCDSVTVKPVLTVALETQCFNLSYSVCPKSLFGNCTVSNNVVQERLLVQAGTKYNCPSGYKSLFGNCTVSNNVVQERLLVQAGTKYNCPSGYKSPTPSSTGYRYKSPRIYFCSVDRRYSSPYGRETTFCLSSSIGLPGAGVSLATGVMAPAGLYPASCIYWNSVIGSVPLYNIVAKYEDEIVPTLLTDLNGKRLVYYYGGSIAIDEMDRLYGVQNSGYDCVTYEMDKILHNPSNCVNYDLPQYDIVSYFSGKVRSSGISRMLDYFTITPIPSNDNSNLVLNFALLEGIDYESAIINNVNTCPTLNVQYIKDSQGIGCLLSGWPTSNQKDRVIQVAGVNVCSGASSCTTSLRVEDSSYVLVSVVVNNTLSPCNKFQCLASTNTFLAYPVDSFSMQISRPELSYFVSPNSNDNYTSIIAQALQQSSDTYSKLVYTSVANLTSSYNSLAANVNNNIKLALQNLTQSNLNSNASTGITITLVDPDLTATIDNIRTSTNITISNLQSNLASIRANISSSLGLTLQEIKMGLDKDYNTSLAKLQELISSYNHTPESTSSSSNGNPISAFQSIGTFGGASIGGSTILIIIIVVAAVVALNAMVTLWIIKRTVLVSKVAL